MRIRELNEMVIARTNDLNLDISDPKIGDMSKIVYDLQWKQIGIISLDLYDTGDIDYCVSRHNTELSWMIGEFSEQVDNGVIDIKFNIFFFIELKSVNSSLPYKNISQVKLVHTKPTLRGRKIATIFYKWLVSKGYSILGDREQYFGARKLWARLSKELDVVVDLVDVTTHEVLEKNVMLHHGNYDHDFDERVYSYTNEKEHIRPILIEILE
jgi:hypothetical protein